MQVIIDFFDKIDNFLEDIFTKILGSMEGGLYIIYTGIAVIAALLIIVGLIAALKKIPRLFILIVLLVGIFCAAAYFIYYY